LARFEAFKKIGAFSKDFKNVDFFGTEKNQRVIQRQKLFLAQQKEPE